MNNRYMRTLAIAGATALLPVVALAAPAHAVDVTIRGVEAIGPGGPQGDVVENRNLGDGRWTFLRDGIAMTAPASEDRSGVYWESRTQEFPSNVSLDWNGTTSGPAAAQPAVVIYIDPDGPGEAPRVPLLHEDVYGNGDLWMPDGAAEDVRAAAPSEGEASGSGSLYAGPVTEWKANLEAAFPDMEIVQVGVNLSGVSNQRSDGVLRAVELGQSGGPDRYTFSSEDEIVPPVEPTVRDVNGSARVAREGRAVTVTLTSETQPDNTVVGQKLRWRIAVDGFTEANIRQGFDDLDDFSRRFAARSGSHTIKVFKNGTQVRSIVVNTGR